MSECIFCKIVAREVAAEELFRNAYALAFLDIAPHAPGHTLVIPTRHIESLTELLSEEGAGFFEVMKIVDRALCDATHAEGMTIGANQGVVAGQTVPHLHMLLMPRFAGDGGSSIHSVVKNPPQESLSAIGAKIRACISQRNVVS